MENEEVSEKPKHKNITVKFISRKKSAALVEYRVAENEFARVSIPANKIVLGTGEEYADVPESVIKSGIPYGIPWESKLPDITVKGSDIEKEFHKMGIWTLDDVRRNPKAIQSVVMAAASDIVRAISNVIKEYSSKEV